MGRNEIVTNLTNGRPKLLHTSLQDWSGPDGTLSFE